tara:strand:+ start:837 stop:1889 length:1053 start_codon:yes stop_codon:yes gene_type:complete
MTAIINTALYNNHQKLKAKCVPFAGYNLPIWFSSITHEHEAVRTSAGMFDISHMGLFIIKGDSSFKFLQDLSCNDVSKCLSKKMVYSMFLNQQGMILDDVMHGFYNDQFYLITNGSNQLKLLAWMEKYVPKDVTITHLNSTHSFIAVQGPKATESLENLYNHPFASISRFGINEFSIHHKNCIVFRTGYTGEDGFELMVPNDIVPKIWQDLLDFGITPCGLGSRDSLRVEKGFPLYGHELSEFIHPFMTQHSWVVKYDTDFIGKEALQKQQSLPHLVNVGLELEGKNIARQDYKIEEGGYVSSGTFIPSINKSIALAFVPAKYSSIGSKVNVIIRNKSCLATVVKVPFES